MLFILKAINYLYNGIKMIGIDIVEIKRIKKLIENEQNAKKLFFCEELCYANEHSCPEVHLAGCFCAKESVVKALGGGFIRDVKVLHYESGKPYVEIFGKTKELLGNKMIEISISHTQELATAICMIVE